MNAERKGFLNGVGQCIVSLIMDYRPRQHPELAFDLMYQMDLELQDFIDAGCEELFIETIRKMLKDTDMTEKVKASYQQGHLVHETD